LKQSLSNFKDATKGAQPDDEYIEEIFEDEAENSDQLEQSIVELSEQDMAKMRQEEES
jgi:rRNA maturation endonuclease Nob1